MHILWVLVRIGVCMTILPEPDHLQLKVGIAVENCDWVFEAEILKN